MNYKILIVDDEPANLRLLERLFRRSFQLISATSGAEALSLLKLHDIALIISDQRMPGMTGIEFLKRAAEMRPQTVRIILTGYTDINDLVEAINSGVVYKYVTKPWVNEDLQQTVERGLQHYETIKRQHDLKQQNERLSEDLKASKQALVRLIAEVLYSKDESSPGRARLVSRYAGLVGRGFNLEADEIEQLSLAAYLHQIGHLIIPDRIFLKAEALTEEERRILKSSSDFGFRMLEEIPGMNDVALTIRYQHEHFDGSGFPGKLSGEQIPLAARILAVVSAYDSMTAPRKFQAALTHEEALERLRANAGKQFDPKVVEAFCELQCTSQIRQAIVEGAMDTFLPSTSFA